MIAMMIEDILLDLGCIVDLASSIDVALAFIDGNAFDGALLDMNIHGQKTYEVAEALHRRAMPFLLVTGYGVGSGDPPIIEAAPRLQKPFNAEDLRRRMMDIFVPRQPSSPQSSHRR